MNSLVFGCPNCSEPFQVLQEQAGQIVECPSCGKTTEIPTDAFGATQSESAPVQDSDQPDQIFQCIHCTGQFGITDEMTGMTVACPHCQQALEIPGAPPAVDEPAAPSIEIKTGSVSRSKRKRILEKKAQKKQAKGSANLPKPGNEDSDLNPPSPASSSQAPQPTDDEPMIVTHRDPRRDAPELTSDLTAPTRNAKGEKPGDETANSTTDPQTDTVAKSTRVDDLDLPPQLPTGSSVPGTGSPVEHDIVATAVDDLLPPSIDGGLAASSSKDSKTGEDANSVSEAVSGEPEKSEDSRDPIDHLLPPRFDVDDPSRIRTSRSDAHKVYLPDGKGGTKQVDQRIVMIEHNGERIPLIALSPQEKFRRKLITNIIALIICIALIAMAFTVLSW